MSDTHFKNLSLDQTSVDKPKAEPTAGAREERSSEFRAGLFSKISMSKVENRQPSKMFADSVINVGGNVPTSMRLRAEDFGKRDKLAESLQKTSKLTSEVEKIVGLIDDKMRDSSYKGSVSVESFKRSIYGRFSDTYKRLKACVDTDQLNMVLSTSFKGSNIVTHPEGIVLYFNLPLSETWLPKTKKIFPINDKPENFTIKYAIRCNAHRRDLLYEFERSNNNTPNVILVQNESRDEKFGGYARDPWSTNKPYIRLPIEPLVASAET